MTSARFFIPMAVVAGVMGLAPAAFAQHEPGTSPAVAAKVMLRGDAHGIRIPEMRAVRRNDVLSVQVDLQNMGNTDRVMFYRFRWIDNVGNQVGDGESWKQLTVLGQGMQTIKSVALTPVAVDFRLEMNVEGR
ncbi:MAG TPA: YcfL family protein [Burkholderiaceae bacterium]|nr:YcfL family protein [Burkholderiaceae bacterium]